MGSNVTDFVDESSVFYPNHVTSMHNFYLLTSGDVEKIIKNFPSKICSLDSIPTWLVKDSLHALLPILIKVVNNSLGSGTFPDTLKQSIITPVLKKSSLDLNILKHYTPVANIKFMSKVIKKAASCQVTIEPPQPVANTPFHHPRCFVIMPSEHFSCPALTMLIRFCLVVAKLISNDCNGYRTR